MKYFLKTLLISFLCGSILMLDMNYKAQSLKLGLNNSHAETLTTGGVSDSDLTSTLTMVAISVITSRLIAYGKITPDIMLAAAGGLSFMAGDVIASSELKEAMKAIQMEIERKDNNDLTDRQRQALIKLLDSYMHAEETAKTKKNLQNAAAIAFLAAAALAYTAAMTETSLMSACGAALSAAQPVASEIGAACDAASRGSCGGAAQAQSCNALTSALKGSMEAYKAGRAMMAPSCSAMPSVIGTRTPLISQNTSTPGGCGVTAPAVAGAVAACSAVFVGDQINESGCVPPAVLYATTAAAVVLMGVTSSLLITAVVGLSAPLSEMVDNAIYVPSRRAIVWAALAAMSYSAASSTENQISEIEGNIRKISDLLQAVNAQEKGEIANNVNIAGDLAHSNQIENIKSTVKNYEANGVDLAVNNSKLPCITSDSKKSDCPSFEKQFNKLPATTGFPKEANSTIANIVKLADGLNGASKISNSTLNTASNLSASGQSLKAILDKQRKDFQDKLTKNGNKLNLLNEESKINKEMSSAVLKALKDSNMSNKDALAALGNSKLIAPEIKNANEATNALATMKKVNANKLFAFKMPAIPPVPVIADPSKVKMGDLKNADEKTTNNADETSNNIDLNPITKKEDSNPLNEINSDMETSIFKSISNRYIKSGYPRLFKSIKE